MVDFAKIKKNAEIIGADGVHVGTVDQIEPHRIRLKKEGTAPRQNHYISVGLIADIENGTVRLRANADVAVTLED